jgi:hypothetical protein
MRRAVAVTLALFALTGCSGRQVEVRTGPQISTDVAVNLTNNLTQAVNFYVVSGITDIFVKQVGSNSSEHIPIQGVAAGSTVTLKAVTVDGTRTYTRDNVMLSSLYEWKLP